MTDGMLFEHLRCDISEEVLQPAIRRMYQSH